MKPHDRGIAALPLAEAIARIDALVDAVGGGECVALANAVGRVLAVDLVSTVDVPAHDNSAMDGYAVRSDERCLPASSGRRLQVVGRAQAGHPYVGPVGPDECVRIFTGAVMPDDCDAVVPQESAVVAGDVVRLDSPVAPGQHRRLAGEDVRAGAIVAPKGRRITPSDLGLAASIGHGTVDVIRKPRVAVFSTGNELRAPGQPLERGQIRDSNRYTLIGMLAGFGVEVFDLGIVADDPAALEAAIRHACGSAVQADAIVTSGGVSAGDADYTRDVMGRVGEVAFWQLAIKPGRPMAFGRVACAGRSAVLFGLPGNPVAAMVVFHALVRNALLKLMGARVEPMLSITAICDQPMPKAQGRTEFVRAIASRRDDGWHIRTTGAQGSGILRSMSEANCLVVLDHERGPVTSGEAVEAWPFDGLL